MRPVDTDPINGPGPIGRRGDFAEPINGPSPMGSPFAVETGSQKQSEHSGPSRQISGQTRRRSVQHDHIAAHHRSGGPCRFLATALAATGVVFGDIGTSPLYTFAGVYNGLLETNQDLPTQEDLIGTFSCIFWGLTLIVCIKYVGCIMRVDHQGEGGTFALLQCIFAGHKDGTTPPLSTGKRYGITLLAMLGCSLLIGDGAITPAMSVLGALEGLGIIVDCPETVRVIIAVVILVLLFAIQRKGSKVIGLVAGPIMIIWFLMLAALGGYNVYLHSHEAIVVSQAFNPKSVYDFFASGKYSGEKAWKSLGGVVLCVTGAEALFADMGHFGALPIAATWYVLVYPALVLQYLGQASMLLHTPANINANPFYSAVPTNLQWPVLIIATLAAIIASQALISGVFTLLAQAHVLNFCPRILVMHTNAEERGQVYIPEVNGVLCVLCILLVVAFRNTDRLGSAYGVAVTGDALITSTLFSIVLRRVWRWPYPCILIVIMPMLCIDLSFWSANIIKIAQAGWVPCVITVICCMLMHTYHWGRTREDQRVFDGSDWHERRRLSNACAAEGLQAPLLAGAGLERAASTNEESECPLAPWRQGAFSPLEAMPINDKELVELLGDPEVNIVRTNACSVFMTPRQERIPLSLQSLAHSFGCLPKTIVLLTVRFEAATPFVSPAERAFFEAIDVKLGVYRIVLYFGYAEPLTASLTMRDDLGKVAQKYIHEYPALRPLLVLSTAVEKSLGTMERVDASGSQSQAPPTSVAERQYNASLTFVVNRLNYKTAPGHSWFTKFRIGLYRIMVFNARKPIRFFGLPADCTVEVSSIKYL